MYNKEIKDELSQLKEYQVDLLNLICKGHTILEITERFGAEYNDVQRDINELYKTLGIDTKLNWYEKRRLVRIKYCENLGRMIKYGPIFEFDD